MADRRTTGEAPDATQATPYLLVRAGGQLCALLLAHVEETLRPLPVRALPAQALGGVPSFVIGLTVLRGEPTPVIDARMLLGDGDASIPITRFVSLRTALRSERSAGRSASLSNGLSAGLVAAGRSADLGPAGRRIALAVDAVQGVARLDATSVAALPSILSAAGAPVVSALGMHDAELLMVLQSGKLVPDEAWDALDAGGAS